MYRLVRFITELYYFGGKMRKKTIVILLVCLLAFSFTACGNNNNSITSTTTQIYVSVQGSDSNSGESSDKPLATLAAARDKVRALNKDMRGDMIVHVGDGLYMQTETLAFDERDAATNGYKIVYKAENRGKAVVSGMKTLARGWTVHDAEKGIYKLAYGSEIDTRQLYADGKRATRARYDVDLSKDTFRFQGDSITSAGMYTNMDWLKDCKNQSGMEFVFKVLWTAPRTLAAEIKELGGETFIQMQQPYWKYANNKMSTSVINAVGKTNDAQRKLWYIENVYEFLDDEGEWYLDKTGAIDGTPYTFYYKPAAGKNVNDIQFEIPMLEQLMRIEGSSVNATCSGLTFDGITFEGGTYLEPNNTGVFDAQNNVIRMYEPDTVPDHPMPDFEFFEEMTGGNIYMNMAKNNTFTECIFTRMGNAAIYMYKGCQNNLIEKCEFFDISAQAIQIGHVDMYDAENYRPQDERLLMRNNDILNNVIHDVAVEYYSASAVGAAYVQDTDICHNVFKNLPYSGIHLGWGWARIHLMGEPRVENNHMDYNYFENLLTELYDGGAIYTLGPQYSAQKRSSISYNYIKDQRNVFGAVYLDEGACYYDVIGNVVENSPYWFGHNGDTGAASKTNVVTKNYTTPANMFVGGVSAGSGCVPSDTVIVAQAQWTQWQQWWSKSVNTTVITTGEWPQEAQVVMARAGLESGVENVCMHNHNHH